MSMLAMKWLNKLSFLFQHAFKKRVILGITLFLPIAFSYADKRY